GPSRPLPGREPASRAARDAWRPFRLVLLDPEPGARGRAARPAVRPGHGDRRPAPPARRQRAGARAHGRLPQPAAALGHRLSVFRKAIFWTHLACGVVAGLVVLMMSVTGVLLTSARQMLAWAARRAVGAPEDDAPRLPAGPLLEAARHQEPAFEPSSLTLAADPRMPAVLSAGRGNARLLDPYTGAILGDGEGGLHAFFDAVRGWHRWFNVEGEGRDAARAVTNACNLAFLFLVLSGAWLWLPPAFGRAALRVRFWFNPKARGGKARDYNWHHVFGIWSAVPLAAIVASATVFHYEWANTAVYRAFGEAPPARQPAPGTARATQPPVRGEGALPLDVLAARAAAAVPGWRRLTLELPPPAGGTMRVT